MKDYLLRQLQACPVTIAPETVCDGRILPERCVVLVPLSLYVELEWWLEKN